MIEHSAPVEEYTERLVKMNTEQEILGNLLCYMVKTGRIDEVILPDLLRDKIAAINAEAAELRAWRLANGYEA